MSRDSRHFSASRNESFQREAGIAFSGPRRYNPGGKDVMENMPKFVSKSKMSKRSLKELAKKQRVIWDISPVTRKTENKKLYNRKKNSHDREDDYGMGVFLCHSGSFRPFHEEGKCRKPCPGLRRLSLQIRFPAKLSFLPAP